MSRLDMKREDEIRRRQGSTGRTIISTIWLGISFVVAYFLVKYLIESGTLSYNTLYTRFYIPSSVPEWAIMGALMLIVVIVMQFALVAGFAFASPIGRTRPGTPSLASRNPDPLDKQKYG